MALTTSRRAYLAGRPPGLGRGTYGSINFHWASVRSEGYGVLLMPRTLPKRPTRDYPFLDTLSVRVIRVLNTSHDDRVAAVLDHRAVAVGLEDQRHHRGRHLGHDVVPTTRLEQVARPF